jgi:hypothetical protein
MKIETITVIDPISQESREFVIVDRGNSEYTSMLKSDYDAMQADSTLPSELVDPAPADKPKK